MIMSAGCRRVAQQAMVSFCLLTSLLLSDGQLGPLSFPLRRMTASVLIVAAICAVRPRRWRFAGTIVALSAVVVAPATTCALLANVMAAAILGFNSAADTDPLVPGVSQACLTYVNLRFASDLVPQSRLLGESISKAAYLHMRAMLGHDHYLSPTALGGPAIVLSTVYILWRWRLSPTPSRLLVAVLFPVAWFLLLPVVALVAGADPVSIFVCGACYGVFWIGCAAVLDAVGTRRAGAVTSIDRRMPRPALICFGLASLVIGTTLVGVVGPAASANKSLLVHNRGGLDWDRPVFGKFGSFSGGMFGLFPVYARANGYRFEVLDKDTIRPGDLAGFQIMVLINSPKQWEGNELRTVRNFVAGGGNLLVLGDHTDVFGLMNGFNTLLSGFGIEFQFDSAYHSRSTWRGCLSASADAVACGWETESPGVAVGASLKLTGWARPLLCGRYAHSDVGSRANVLGSFLGNYAYDEGEKLGDIVLVASTTHGRGRVIVFGDTSPFQGSIDYTFPRTVGPILRLLSRPVNFVESHMVRLVAASLLTTILLVCWASRYDALSIAAISSMLFLGVGWGLAANRPQLESPIALGSDCVLIDKTHLPATGHYAARVNPVGPLSTNLLRCGLRVAYFDRWDRESLSKVRGIAFISPRRTFTRGQIDDLLRFEQAGGIVVLAVGQPEASASRPLLAAHDLELAARPLGTVPHATAGRGRKEQETPRFLDAWPIVSITGEDLTTALDVDVLYRFEDDTTALFRRRGRGGLLLFSDSRFFSSMNVEDVLGHWVGNLAFIHDVFRKYFAVDPDQVHPVFRSPDKPQ
jgi:hypothetical protein